MASDKLIKISFQSVIYLFVLQKNSCLDFVSFKIKDLNDHIFLVFRSLTCEYDDFVMGFIDSKVFKLNSLILMVINLFDIIHTVK